MRACPFCASLCFPCLPDRPSQDVAQHRAGELPGKRVLLTRVVGSQEYVVSDAEGRAVGELRPRPWNLVSRLRESLQACVERERPERDENGCAWQKRQLALQVLPAVVQFFRKGPVARRRASDGGRNERSGELQPVARPARLGLIGESRFIQGTKEKIARLVSSKDPPGAVSPMRGRRQTHDEDTCPRIAKRGERSGPVTLAAETPRRVFSGGLSPRDQSRTEPAGDDVPLELPEAVAEKANRARTCP